MSLYIRSTQPLRAAAWTALLTVAWLATQTPARAQFFTQQVGGVSIDARGVVRNVRVDELNQLKRERQQALVAVPGDLKAQSLRKVSLRQLEAAIARQREGGKPLSDEMRYLAGMQRIQYVFVYPEHHDIVLAGPGEGWKVNPQGEIVGLTTNRPVLLLDDLLVALRSIGLARQGGIHCSIDPTSEGLARLQTLFKSIGSIDDGNPQPAMNAIEQSLGPQTVSVGGVPETSHFARVLVAADYRMKRLAMAFEESPIAGLPNFLQLLKTSKASRGMMLPRWWLAPDYDALVTDGEGLAWELHKAGVKAMTEEETINASGQRQRAAQSNPLAKKWADNMTAHYEELSAKEAIFGQLRNCMDLAVVAALVEHEQLAEKCGWSMPLLLNPELAIEEYHAPREVASQASTVQRGSSWIITASGGVSINPWQPLEKPATDATLSSARAQATAPPTDRWWWN